MKKLKIILVFLTFVSVLSCEKDIKVYDGESNIYFLRSVSPDKVNSALFDKVYDSLVVTFAFDPLKNDSLVRIPVSITGKPVNMDRDFNVAVSSLSTAVAGVHYEALPSSFTMHAGQVIDTIPVKLLRTPDMVSNEFTIMLELQPNEHFKTGMIDQVANATTGQKLSHTTFKLKANDVLTKPSRWLDTYMGIFTRKKLLLLSELLDIPVDALNQTTTSISQVIFYAKYMQRYLNEKKAAGETIYEDDGTEMEMGPSAQ